MTTWPKRPLPMAYKLRYAYQSSDCLIPTYLDHIMLRQTLRSSATKFRTPIFNAKRTMADKNPIHDAAEQAGAKKDTTPSVRFSSQAVFTGV